MEKKRKKSLGICIHFSDIMHYNVIEKITIEMLTKLIKPQMMKSLYDQIYSSNKL